MVSVSHPSASTAPFTSDALLDGKEAFVYRGHEDSVLTVAWSPDGQHLASAGRDDLVHVWKTVQEHRK
ncbi:MAG TPA: WD40 repeat domain-containing protein [Ktedonobacteraceae bacterium]|nr:WD40 repeat domain-containing protein [Ktedonobacteraceae bacterium]